VITKRLKLNFNNSSRIPTQASEIKPKLKFVMIVMKFTLACEHSRATKIDETVNKFAFPSFYIFTCLQKVSIIGYGAIA
jgi:hypothetical protein